ncbi:MAG TPA: hypothetical protein VGR00_09865 [Thermoanaerobaculia bacterium]|nr:hypothetical protein [Thermoanaerobaculia bacterium]
MLTAVLPRSLFAVKRGLCPGCGAPLPIDAETASTTCRFCGMRAVLERRLRKVEPEVEGAPLPLYLDAGGAEAGKTGLQTPWVRSRQFRESFVEHVVCPGCGDEIALESDEGTVECRSCGTQSRLERRLWAPLPDPATEIPRRRRSAERRGAGPVDADPETEQMVWRVVNERDAVKKILLAWKLGENWCYANKTSARLLPAVFQAMKGADPRFQYAASQIVCKLLCEGEAELRNATVRAAERFLFDTACPRDLVFEVGMGDGVCCKPLLDAAEVAMRRGDFEYACAALLSIDWIFQRNFAHHQVMGEIILYRMLYLSGPVLAFALLLAQRQVTGTGFYYPAETLLSFIDDAAVERPILVPELDKAFYCGLPENEAEYTRRRDFYDTLKTNASRRSALTRWLYVPEEASQDLYREIALFLTPLLGDPELSTAAEKSLCDLVSTPREVPQAVHALVAEKRDALPAETRRAYLRRVPETKLLDPRAIPYWEGEKEPGLSPEIAKALAEWKEGLVAAADVHAAHRDAFHQFRVESLGVDVPVFEETALAS